LRALPSTPPATHRRRAARGPAPTTRPRPPTPVAPLQVLSASLPSAVDPAHPAALAALVQNSGLPPLTVIAGILVFYVILGCVMDELSMILLTLPIFLPTVIGLDLYGLPTDLKLIWFGILVLMVVEIGLIAPPVGLNVYVINGLAKNVPIGESYRGVVPFLISDVLRTALLLMFPWISLWLVKVLVP